jgi:hypothetical protein
MNSTLAPSRRWRLQFGIRGLLVLMTAVAVSLHVYRLPWTESTARDEGINHRTIITTTLRRGWNGKPHKHGPERHLYLHREVLVDYSYVDGELQRERHYHNGRMTQEYLIAAGKSHSVRTVELPSDEINGVWETSVDCGDEIVHQSCPWRNGARHGLSTWTSSSGKLLQSAKFELGRLTKWNGEPVAAALAKWRDAHLTTEHDREQFAQLLLGQAEYQYDRQPFEGYFWRTQGFLTVHYSFTEGQHCLAPPDWRTDSKGRPMFQVLLEGALNNSGTLDYRFGTICFVPICTKELNWRDRTGCDEVKFATLQQEFEWNRPTDVDWSYLKMPAQQLKYLCAGTSVKLDTTAIDQLDTPPSSTGMSCRGPQVITQPRRLFFARVLDKAGYRVEQREGKLIVLPNL